MYICVTYIDAITGVVCTEAPMATGPVLPQLTGWKYEFANESAYPIKTKADGSFESAPLFYGTCDNNANIDRPGIIKKLTKAEFDKAREDELAARPAPVKQSEIK